MTLQYTPGGDPSAVYYGTDTHASALLIGAALALACPLRSLAAIPAAHTRRLDMRGVVGIVVLAWAAGHFSGGDPGGLPGGPAARRARRRRPGRRGGGSGVIAAITSWPPLRWIGVRSYGIYLWHWPVIALADAITGPGPTSPWLWLVEAAVTISLAAASWRFIETPILRDGLRATIRRWMRLAAKAGRRPAGTRSRAFPVTLAAAVAITFVVACYGVARPPAPDAPAGLLRQVANGERVSNSSRSTPSATAGPVPAGVGGPRQAGQIRVPLMVCRHGQPRVPGGQVTAVGDSVMLASATALEAALPGVYIDAKIDRQMQTGLTLIRSLADASASGTSSWSASARTAASPPASSGSCSEPSGRAASSCWSARSARSPGSTRSTRRSPRPPGAASTPNWPTGTRPSRPVRRCSGRTASTRARRAPASTRASCSRRSRPG